MTDIFFEKYNMNKSPAFSKFRSLMDKWDNQVLHEKMIDNFIDENGLLLFFTKGKDCFGAPEQSRLVFAKLKDDDQECDEEGWRDEASFMALNLKDALMGDKKQHIFSNKDLGSIKIIDKNDLYERLK